MAQVKFDNVEYVADQKSMAIINLKFLYGNFNYAIYKYRKHGKEWSKEYTVTTPKIVLGGLDVGTSYQIAIKGDGDSDFKTYTFTHKPTNPKPTVVITSASTQEASSGAASSSIGPCNVRSIRINNITSNSVEVEVGGNYSGLTLSTPKFRYSVHKIPGLQTLFQVETTSTSVFVDKLLPNTKYEARAALINCKYTGVGFGSGVSAIRQFVTSPKKATKVPTIKFGNPKNKIKKHF